MFFVGIIFSQSKTSVKIIKIQIDDGEKLSKQQIIENNGSSVIIITDKNCKNIDIQIDSIINNINKNISSFDFNCKNIDSNFLKIDSSIFIINRILSEKNDSNFVDFNFEKILNFETLEEIDEIFNSDSLGRFKDEMNVLMKDFPKNINDFLNGIEIEIDSFDNEININFSLNLDSVCENTKIKVKIIDLSKKEMKRIDIQEEKINSILELKNLSFFPNPNNGKFSLSFASNEKGKIQIEIFDLKGNKIYEEKLKDFSGKYLKKIDLSKKGKGIFLLKITQNEKVLIKKLICN